MLLSLILAAAAADDPSAEELLDAVVLVEQGDTMCAGAFVGPDGIVATAYHCVASGGRPAVTTRAGVRAVGVVVHRHPAANLALVQVELEPAVWLEPAAEPPELGGRVRALGHPFGTTPPGGFLEGTLRWSLSEGVVSAIGPTSLQITAPLNPGNSGGPVVDSDGRLVGVVSRILRGRGLGFAGRVTHLEAPLAGSNRRKRPVGGTVALGGVLGTLADASDGALTLGVRFELALRDRVLAIGGVSAPTRARWDTARFGSTSWSSAEVLGGLRQRIGRGPFALRIDAVGGVMVLDSLVAEAATPFSQRRTNTAVPAIGGQVQVRGVGLDLLAELPDGAVRVAVTVRWPGVMWVL